MMIRTLNITLGILVAFSVWCAALMLAVFLAVLALHVLVIGGFTVYHLLYPWLNS
jgi:hypothetical protein